MEILLYSFLTPLKVKNVDHLISTELKELAKIRQREEEQQRPK